MTAIIKPGSSAPKSAQSATAAKVAQTATDPFKNVRALLEGQKAQIARALPKHLTPDRLIRIATTELSRNPELLACEPISFIGAIIQCAQLGLEPGSGLGHAYLIPFWNGKKGVKEVQFIPGYRGLIDLARRSGQIKSISSRVVYEGDEFEYEYGLSEKLIHRPARLAPGEKPPEVIAAYAVAKLMDGGEQFEVMERWRIERARSSSKNKNPVWENWFDEMARKTCVRNLFKYLPVSIEIANLIEADDRADTEFGQDNAQTLLDVGVKPIENSVTPMEIDQVATESVQEKQRLDVLDRIEKKIAEKYKTGDQILELEAKLGMGLGAVAELPIEQLMAVWEVVK